MYLFTKCNQFKFSGKAGYLDFVYGPDSIVNEIAPTTDVNLLINGILDPEAYFIESCLSEASVMNGHAYMTGFTIISKEASKAIGNFLFILRVDFVQT